MAGLGQCLLTAACLCFAVTVASFADSGVVDYCQWELFNASCPEGSLVVMSSAKYGRMRLGRCIDTDFQIGCSADVLLLVDIRCSGRPSCFIPLPDNTLHHQQPCARDMMAYLEASYTCITVSDAEPKSCLETGSIQLMQDEGYLSSYMAQTVGHGTSSCPWIITVKAGQRIRLTIFEFSMSSRYRTDVQQSGGVQASAGGGGGGTGTGGGAGGHQQQQQQQVLVADYCHLYATVSEGSRSPSSSENICAVNAREHVAYTSVTNSISVELSEQIVADDSVSFVIKFAATGCADLEAPKNAWTERSGDRVTVRCNHTLQSWHMVCKGVAWVGQTSECQEDDPTGEKIVDDSQFPTYGLVIAVVIGVFVGSFCGFLLLAIVLWCKRQTSPRYDAEVELVAPSGESDHVCKVHRLPTGEYGYTHVWEVRNTQLPMPPSMAGAGASSFGSSLLHRPSSTDTPRSMATDSAYQTSSTEGCGGGAGHQSMQAVDVTGLAGLHPRKEHVYECPIFDERFLLQRLQQAYPHHCPHDPATAAAQQRTAAAAAAFCPHGRGYSSGAAAAVLGAPIDQGRTGVATQSDRALMATTGNESSRCPLTTEDGDDDDRSRSNFTRGHGYTPVFTTPDQEQGSKPTKATENHYL